jgi:hypothetical protein
VPGGGAVPGSAHRAVPAALAQQSALQHSRAIHVDVPAEPLAPCDVRVLLTGSASNCSHLPGRRGHQALLRPVGVVEHIQVRDYARIRPWCRGNRILAKNALSIETVYRWRAKRPRDGCLSVLRQHVEPSRPQEALRPPALSGPVEEAEARVPREPAAARAVEGLQRAAAEKATAAPTASKPAVAIFATASLFLFRLMPAIRQPW